jgi:hypothetical protein
MCYVSIVDAGIDMVVSTRRTTAVNANRARPSGTVWLWSALGLALVGLAVTCWTTWLLSPQATPVDPGPDPYSFGWVIRLTEVVSLSVFAMLLWFTLLRPAYRRRTVTLDGKLFLGGLFASVLDVLCQMFNPTWAMNAHSLNLGTWARQFPGFAAPQADRWAWSLGWCMPAYIWLGVGAAIVGCAYLDALRRRFPRLCTVALYAVVLVPGDRVEPNRRVRLRVFAGRADPVGWHHPPATAYRVAVHFVLLPDVHLVARRTRRRWALRGGP